MKMKYGGWTGKLLVVDLGEAKTEVLETLVYGREFLGGRGIGVRIAWDEIGRGITPYDPANRIFFLTGPLTGTSAPNSSRTTICSLSPQVYPYEWFTYSSIGGFFGPALKYAGYDGIIVKGISHKPVYLLIVDEKVRVMDGSKVWGEGIFRTQEILKNLHGESCRVLSIGPAGERKSRIAIIGNSTGSAAGQGGFGGVMGAKRLKAIAVIGTGSITLADPERFTECTIGISKEIEVTMGMPKPPFIDGSKKEFQETFSACGQQCAAPKCHITQQYCDVPGVIFPGRKYKGIIMCESKLFQGFENTHYNWKLGFNAGYEIAQISQDLGINHWELGLGLVPWLRLCHQSGQLEDIDGMKFDLDDPEFWYALVTKIAFREGIGDALSEGGPRASEILGIGREYVSNYWAAWGFGGHWDGRGDKINKIFYPFWIVTALQWALGSRDPLSSGHGYAQNVMNWSKDVSGDDGLSWDTIQEIGRKVYGHPDAANILSGYEGKVSPAIFHQHRSVLKDSLTLCDQVYPMIYSRKDPDHIARTRNGLPGTDFERTMFNLATGLDMDTDEFEGAAERIFNLERMLHVRNWKRDRETDEKVLPYFGKREEWENPLTCEKKALDTGKFRHLLSELYKARGWDPETGIPYRKTLIDLGLEFVC